MSFVTKRCEDENSKIFVLHYSHVYEGAEGITNYMFDCLTIDFSLSSDFNCSQKSFLIQTIHYKLK